MRHILTAFTVVMVFAFGMTASMAQIQQQDPGTIKVTPPPQSSPIIQTQPTPIPNLNTSKNPYEQKRYMEVPTQQKK